MANDQKKVSQLGVVTTLSSNDRVVVLTNPQSAAQTQTITVNNFINNVVPRATSSVYGTVKIGDNLYLNANNKLSSYYPDIANSSHVGLVRPGTGLNINENGVLTVNASAVNPTDLTAVESDIIPVTDNTYSLGNSSNQWKSLYVTSNTIYIGGVPLSISNGSLTINNTVITASANSDSVTGYTGSQGEVGYTGSVGDVGYTGSVGDVGYTGSQGNIGYTGSVGDVGYTGSVGDVGYTGSVGDVGYTGSVGDVGYTGSAGSSGSNGYTGSQGIVGYTGSLGYTGSAGNLSSTSNTNILYNNSTAIGGSNSFYFDNTTNNVVISKLVVTTQSTLGSTQESLVSYTNANGIFSFDCSNSTLFYLTTPQAAFTPSLTNLVLTNNEVTAVTLIINQGLTPYVTTSNVRINSSTNTTISWQGGLSPSGSASKTDVVTLSILNVNNAYTVLGQLTSFG